MTAGLNPPPPLETQRLIVRHVHMSDLADLLVVNGHDDVTRYLPYASWASIADARAWLERMQRAQASGSALQWAVVDKASAAVIGSCLLFQYDAPSALAELGYVLGRAYWGQGLGFTSEGILRQRWVTKGEARDVESFGLLRPEWRATR